MNQDQMAEGIAKAIRSQPIAFKDNHYMGEPRWDSMRIEDFAKAAAKGAGIRQTKAFAKKVQAALGPYPKV